MAFEPKYEYYPILEPDGIRLIELQPSADPSAALQCTLMHTKLSLCDNRDIFGHYTALSYVWGNPEKNRKLFVDGRCLHITTNLCSALLDLRDDQRSLLLWADGICINQANDAEKGTQVGLMGRIYAGALHTVIYLGPAAFTGPECRCLKAIQDGTHEEKTPNLNIILTETWFTRVWVFQELVSSRSPWLQCGRTRVKWDMLFNVLDPETYQGDAYSIITNMQAARKYHLNQENNMIDRSKPTLSFGLGLPSKNSMMDLLLRRRGFGATDPRDMIFSHVGFASGGEHELFTVDYSKTTFEVFESAARYIAEYHGIANLLHCRGSDSSSGSLKDLPSWVPDWTSKISEDRLPKVLCPGSLKIPLIHYDQPGVLGCIVEDFDTIWFLSSTLSERHLPMGTRHRISANLVALDDTFINEDDFARRPRVRTRGQILDELWCEAYHAWSCLIQDKNFLLLELKDLRLQVLRESSATICKRSWKQWFMISALDYANGTNSFDDQRLARMASGRLELVPKTTQKEDIVVTCYSHDSFAVRSVFRPIQPSPISYRGFEDAVALYFRNRYHSDAITRNREGAVPSTTSNELIDVAGNDETSTYKTLNCKFIGGYFEHEKDSPSLRKQGEWCFMPLDDVDTRRALLIH